MTGQEPEDGLDAAILDGILKRLPAATDAMLARPLLIGMDLAAGTATFEVDDQTAAMIRRGMVGSASIGPVGASLVDRWNQVGTTGAPPILIPVDPPDLELIDVNWPDGTVKVFPDREEYTFNVETLVVEPAAADVWSRIMDEVRFRRLEETILEELSAIITERGKDAPGLLIIQTPDGQWAIKESAWLAPGSAMLSRVDVPDLMAVAQGDGWLYYRQARPTPDQAPEEVHLDIIPELGEYGRQGPPGPEPWARSAWEADLPD